MRKVIVLMILAVFVLVACEEPGSGPVVPSVVPPVVYDVGDTGPAGGTIFYVDANNDFSWTYLEAAPASTEWTDDVWSSSTVSYINGTLDTLGSGSDNTGIVAPWLNNDGQTLRAAQNCYNLVSGGSSDWFLPSEAELDLIYTNLRGAGLGGFSADLYWSSTENNNAMATRVSFSNGISTGASKTGSNSVRAIRSF